MKRYFIYMQLDHFWTINYFALIVLCFIERPLWCGNYDEDSCNDRGYYFLGQLPYLTGTASLIYEVITFIILVGHILFPILFEGSEIYWKKIVNRVKAVLLMLMAVDIFIYALYTSQVAFSFLPVRISPYIRVIFFVLSVRELSTSFLVVAKMLPTYLNVVALTLLYLMFSSWIAYLMFEDTKQGETFTSYATTLYQMFVLFTLWNNPYVWIPAYKDSRGYSLFFLLYVLLGVYFVSNLILASVFNSFLTELRKQIEEMDKKKRHILDEAFKLIAGDDGYLDKDNCWLLFTELNKFRTLPKLSKEDYGKIFAELDASSDNKICQDEFSNLCDVIALKFAKGECESYFEYLPFYNSVYSCKLKTFVRDQMFANIIVFILSINLIAVIIETTIDIRDSAAQMLWLVVEFVFGWIYFVEVVLKIYAYGFVNYWRDGQNRFDFIITCVIVIGETVAFASPNGQTFLSNGEWIRYLILARVLRLTKLLMHFTNYRTFVATFFTLIPSLMPYLGTVFCVLCIYSSLGIQLFGGLVNVGNPSLEGTGLAENDLLLFNFNDYPNAMVTTFNIVVMGISPTHMQTYKDLTDTSWTLLYFISFYIITVMLILNMISVFVVEAFFNELELESESASDEEEERKKRWGRYGQRNQKQKLNNLLHRMLQ